MKCSEESRRSLFLHCATCLLLTFPAGMLNRQPRRSTAVRNGWISKTSFGVLADELLAVLRNVRNRPRPTVPVIRAVATLLRREPLILIQRRANVEFPVDWLLRMYAVGISEIW
jgi:hypothetical protein